MQRRLVDIESWLGSWSAALKFIFGNIQMPIGRENGATSWIVFLVSTHIFSNNAPCNELLI
jgi:hypothetical protein